MPARARREPVRSILLGLVWGGALLLGCARSEHAPGGEPKSAPAEPREADKAGPPGAERFAPIVIKFADPGNLGAIAYAKREGILARELARVNAKIEWVPGAGSFSASFEAMNAGAINASGGAISPIVGALSHNLKFKIFSIGDPGGLRRSGVIAPSGSSIRELGDLVGKRVAVNWAAHGDYVLLRALQKHGIPAHQVTRVPIQPPDAAAAFATSKIDAWSTFGVFFTTALENGAHVLAYEADIESDDVTVTSAHVDVLSRNPAAFQVFVRVIQDLTRQSREIPEKFQNLFTDKGPRATSGARLRADIEETRVAPVQRVPTVEDRARVAKVSQLLFENKSIDRQISVDEIVFDVDAAALAAAGQVR
jgi:sulfonate transport system substrate-binding protein